MNSVNDFRASHAVVVGINDYQNGIPQLRTAVNDARRIGQLFAAKDFGYSVQFLTEDVTLEKLTDLFGRSMPELVQPDDRLFVYFAGHGIALDGDDGPEGYIVPQDARPDDRKSFLPMTDLSRWLENLPCRHLLLVLDCCFAGAFRWSSTRELGDVPPVLHRERYDRYIRDAAWQVITSAAYDQKALDVLSGAAIGLRAPEAAQGASSPFAEAFLGALKGEADLYPRSASGKASGDGVITATELYLYLRACVEDSAEHDGHRQTPGLWPLKKHDKGEYIYLVPGHELNLPPAPELNEASNPYRGLQSYDEQDAPVFFGRSQFVQKLAERVAGQPLTIVLGASGTGKSSVVKAGLIPRLRATEPNAWLLLPPIRPGKSPLASLASLTLPGLADDLGTRVADFLTDPAALATRVGAWAAREPAGRLLLVVDQFEELITLCWDAGEREQFLRLLAGALAAQPDRLRVVLTLRSDFEPQFGHTPLEGDWMSSRIVVPAMALDEYREVIEGPASVKVIYFQGKNRSQDFIDRLIGDVANTPGALPLLSFTLSELYRRYLERKGDDRSLQEVDYEALGGIGGSLRNRATEVYDGLPDDAARATMRRVMLRMISAETGELARRRVPDGELVYREAGENARVADVLRRLTEARLVVEGKETDDQPFVEPAHDELVRAWDRLLEWARQGQEGLLLRRVLTPAADDWRRGTGGLWDGNPRLSLVRRVLESPTGWLNQTESDFVQRSVLKRRAILGGTVATVAAAFLVLSGITWYALDERNFAKSESVRAVKGENAAIKNEGIAKEQTRIAEKKEKIATSRRLAALSSSERGKHLDRSLLLAARAQELESTFESRDSLLSALREAPFLDSFLHCDEVQVSCVSFSADGKILAIGYAAYADPGVRGPGALAGARWGGGVLLFDVAGRNRLAGAPMPVAEGGVKSVCFSPDGKTVAAGYDGGLTGQGVVIWDVAGQKRLPGSPLAVQAMNLETIAYSRDGKTLAVGYSVVSAGDRVTLITVAGGAKISGTPLPVGEGTVETLAFSPDDKILAAGYRAGRFGEGQSQKGSGVILWDLAARQRRAGLPLAVPDGYVTDVAFSSDGATVAAGFHNADSAVVSGGIAIWEVATRRSVVGAPLHIAQGGVFSVAFSPDGKTLAAGCLSGQFVGGQIHKGGSVLRWDVDGSGRIAETPAIVDGPEVRRVSYTPDGRILAAGYAVSFNDSGVVLWDVASAGRLAQALPELVKGGGTTVAYSPDGNVLAIAYPEAGVVLWDVPGRKRLAGSPLTLAKREIGSLGFSPDGKTLAAAYTGNPGSIELWDLARRKRLAGSPLAVTEGEPSNVTFAADGKTLAIGYGNGHDGGVILWDAVERRRLTPSPLTLEGKQITSVAFSPDSKVLAGAYFVYAEGGGVEFWDIEKRARLEGSSLKAAEGWTMTVAYSPSGNILAAGYMASPAGGVVMWDMAGRGRLAGSPTINGNVTSLVFSPDGTTLAAGYMGSGLDESGGGVLLWDSAGLGSMTARLFVPKANVTRVAFSPDSKTLAVGYMIPSSKPAGASERSDNILLWNVDSESWVRESREIANRDFTPEEIRVYSLGKP